MEPSLSELRYRPAAQILHWIIAVAVIGLIVAGLVIHYNLVAKPTRLIIAFLHIGAGLTIFALMALRLLYRWRRTPPPLPDAIPRHEHILAALGHWSLYALILAMPVFGVLFMEGAGRTVTWFGVFALPQFVGKNPAIHHDFAFLHFWGGIALIALVAIHVGAVARHHRRGHKVLHRMLPKRASN
ncbi:cytochrome b [Acidiphilium sp. AL]|uniref:Cytochrome b n=1 Tax=Acidiphilium iwatense TaxID=768198 RepID=A0ABS9DXN2_9PROT|nr:MULTISPECIES: cytochrome b [Acidiphilium]MCF3947490.1 cytochrome b [Acidiphilium iwatense]MCU4158543.1 cytochrome b [Acidiphilium sp. AL]